MTMARIARCLTAFALLLAVTGAATAPDGDDRTLSAVLGPPAQLGGWWAPPLPDPKDRMQAVHVALLPSGKVLIVNGSSNRNRVDENGVVRDGVFTNDYASVNNTSLFDPNAPQTSSGMTRIASPPSPLTVTVGGKQTPLPNDLFCSGHLQLPDGNVMFVGGSQNYYPGEKFLGSRLSSVFDWKTETWRPNGVMTDGHWYPSVVPLADGRLMVVSGLSWDHFSNSSWVEFYDASAPAGLQWSAVDIRMLKNGPFSTPVKPLASPLPMTMSHGVGQPVVTGLDELDHYPRIAPLPDGRFLITGDGSGGGNVTSTHTYLMTVGPRSGNGTPPAITFALGPERSEIRKTFGTAFLDPNAAVPGTYVLLGGLRGSGDNNIGPGYPQPDPRITAVGSAERYSPPAKPGELGRWTTFARFLGDRPNDTRIMHDAVLLPTKQVLVMGGGTFGESQPVYSPLLLTPDAKSSTGYSVRTMNPGTQPRLYHTTALLLPDGRVFLAGGNPTRATRDVRDGSVRLDTVRLNNGTYVFAADVKGRDVLSSEIYQTEIFYPPYLFAAGARPAIAKAPQTIAYGQPGEITVTDATPHAGVTLIKLGSMTHAWDMGQRLAPLRFTQSAPSGTAVVRFTAPAKAGANLYPPGYYMLFYVNDKGKPSKAAIVRLG